MKTAKTCGDAVFLDACVELFFSSHTSSFFWGGGVETGKRGEKRCCDADYSHQRFLQDILQSVPTTAYSAQFDLLCHQPEPFPRTLTASIPQFPL